MNIFVTNYCPKISARSLCDIHLRSQLKESAQMLANAFSLERLAESDCPRTQKGHPRKHGYPRHPCTLWSYRSKENFMWLIEHTKEMDKERLYRDPSKNRHFSLTFVDWCENNVDDIDFKGSGLTKFAVAISEDKKCREITGFDGLPAIDQYKLYYIYDKPFAKWTRRMPPSWFKK